ncbi:MAG: FMN-dependent NADH-azoreductase [Anaerobacillus sp.]
MAQVLYITVNPKSVKDSFSLSIGEAFLTTYQKEKPNDDILKLDLYNIDIPYIDTDVFNGWGKLQQGNEFDHLSADEQLKVSRINDLTDQFIKADKYVFVTPFWNFSFPPKLKAYIDTIAIAGKTFNYTADGPVGLLTDKKALHIQSRGGIYSEGPAKEMEFGDRYLHAILSFLGIPSIESVIAEGMAQMPENAEEIKEKAIEEAREAAINF